MISPNLPASLSRAVFVHSLASPREPVRLVYLLLPHREVEVFNHKDYLFTIEIFKSQKVGRER